MRAGCRPVQISAIANKYSEPLREFPEDWDAALLNVYRADLASSASDDAPRGRRLINAAREAKDKLRGTRVLVATGDADRVVPTRASQRTAELLSAESYVELEGTGHLPMDERPGELASLLLDFFSWS